jgi:hypothetical protein
MENEEKIDFVEKFRNSRLFKNQPSIEEIIREDKKQKKLIRLKISMKSRKKRIKFYKNRNLNYKNYGTRKN